MDYKKKYEQALTNARQEYNTTENVERKQWLEELFPELKESEDEKIRKEIISFIQDHIDEINLQVSGDYDTRDKEDIALQEWCKEALTWLENIPYTIDHKKREGFRLGYKAGLEKQKEPELSKDLGDYIAELSKQFPEVSFAKLSRIAVKVKNWLEKQGEQKPIIDGILTATNYDKMFQNCKVPKFKVGDWVFIEEVKGYKNGPFQIKSVDSFGYSFDEYHTIPFMYEELLSKWTIQDAKDGDVLCYKDEISLYKHDIKNCTKQETTFGGFVYHCCYDGKRFIIDSLYSLTEQDKMDIHPATKEQRDQLEKAMADAGYEWNAEKKELKEIEDEEYNGEDYGIDSLYHAQRILEKTLGKVDGYQTDDGILDHKCAISAVKKLYEQKSAWSEDDEEKFRDVIRLIEQGAPVQSMRDHYTNWFKSLKERVQPQPKQEWCVDDNHEYFSDLLEKDDCDNIDDYAYQCAYCMSHDWIKETATWDDIQKACKLGAEWNEKHHKSAGWSEEDKDFMYDTLSNLTELKDRYGEGYGNVGKCIDWLKSFKQRMGE